MGATFARSRTFVAGETLTATNLNGVETNILNNFTPAGMDDYSTDATEMRVTTDPYPASAESLATSLKGELERLRYVIAQITGKTYWYQDPDAAISALLPKAGGTMTGDLIMSVDKDIRDDITTVASATTPDVFNSTGRLIDYTGTATATGFVAAPQAGMEKILLCAGAAVFTNGANFVIAGGNFTAAAGDIIICRAETTTKFRLFPVKADGTAVVATAITAASQAEQEAGSSVAVMTTPGRQQYHPSAAKAWVMFNGTGTPAVTAGYNVSSITDNGTGDYTVNFTTAFSSANFACIGTATEVTLGSGSTVLNVASQAAGSVRIYVSRLYGLSTQTAYDPASVYVACYGDQ